MRTTLPWLRRALRELGKELLDAVLPPACPACREPGPGLCERCRRALVVTPPGGCPRCGAPLGPDARCRESHDRVRHLRQVMAPFAFVGSGGVLVRRFKLDGDASAGRLLARAMADTLRERLLPRGRVWLVPVPLHRARLRRRGFDQAAWLAREVGARAGVRVLEGVLQRRRATLPQGDPRVLSRVANVRGAFRLAAAAVVQRRDLVLIDDVFTTGATARACAELLIAAGARSVSLLTACRS
ncbi:MAG: ComF family protein [Planctomycetota bacterium]